MFDPRHLKDAKLFSFSLFIFSAIIFLIHADTIIYHDFLHSAKNKEPSENLQDRSHRLKEQIISSLPNLPLHSIQEKNDGIHTGNQNGLVAPLSVTEIERIAWFQKNLHKFDILKSNNLTRRFHARVLEFFGRECEARFFMTWISPAGLFGVREMMSVESVFKVHPGACLVILSRTLETKHGYTVLKPLLDGGFKVQVMTPDLPFLVSRVIKRLLKRPGFKFKILPPMAFYPADWNKIMSFLRKPKTQTESKWVEAKVLQLRAETYGVHLWNRQTIRFTIEEGSVIGKLALDTCVICNHVFSS